MTGPSVDDFSARLNNELAALSWQEVNELLIRIGRAELKMRSDGQERPVWSGPLPESHILGADVVVPTEQGDRRGRVICFGVMNMGNQFERTVVVHVPASGTQFEAPGSVTRLANPEDSRRIQNELEMAERLRVASAAASRGPTPIPRPEKAKKRGQKDPRLVAEMHEAAKASNNVSSIEEGATNFKFTGRDANKRIYLFKNQLRCDISGFSFDHPGLRRISDDEARDMHLGKVRGQLIYDDRDQALAAFKAALEGLK